jgi:8-oxo-dGTP pyrophosphatase MutT (NUDIX family)
MWTPPRRVRSRSIARYPLLELREHDLEADGAGTEHTVVTVELLDWVVVVARTEDGQWLLVEQHRHGVDAATLEPAGGVVDPGESAEQAAPRELMEETGYAGGTLVSLGWVHSNPALSNNRVHLYFVDGVARQAEPESSFDEHTVAVLLGDDELASALETSRISHGLGVLALERARARVSAAAVERRLAELEAHQRRRVSELARRLRPDLGPDALLSPHDFPELRDPDWHFEDGQLAGIQAARFAIVGRGAKG